MDIFFSFLEHLGKPIALNRNQENNPSLAGWTPKKKQRPSIPRTNQGERPYYWKAHSGGRTLFQTASPLLFLLAKVGKESQIYQ